MPLLLLLPVLLSLRLETRTVGKGKDGKRIEGKRGKGKEGERNDGGHDDGVIARTNANNNLHFNKYCSLECNQSRVSLGYILT